MAKSITVVTPPRAAARVPVSQSSLDVVPQNGSSRWTWTSSPPGIRYFPEASTTVTASAVKFGPTSAIVSPLMATSAVLRPSGLTTVAPVITRSNFIEDGASSRIDCKHDTL